MEFIKAIMKCNYITKKHAFYWYEEKNELEIENLEQKMRAPILISMNRLERKKNNSKNGSCTNVYVCVIRRRTAFFEHNIV